jgi:predicted DNA-binding transcriptional regulator AlpA
MTKADKLPHLKDLDANRYVTEAAAAHLLGVSYRTLYRMAERGEGPPRLKLSDRMVRYRLADIEAWVNERAGA